MNATQCSTITTCRWILDLGSWVLDLEFWILDLGSRVLDPQFWILDLEFWILDLESAVLDPQFWILDPSWILDLGFWILELEFCHNPDNRRLHIPGFPLQEWQYYPSIALVRRMKGTEEANSVLSISRQTLRARAKTVAECFRNN